MNMLNIDPPSRMRKYRPFIAAAHRASFLIGRRFPNAVPLFTVTGYPKSGTTWVCQMASLAMDLPYPRLPLLPISFPAVVHTHRPLEPGSGRALYVVRDGRDVMVSLFFHVARRQAAPNSGLSRWFGSTEHMVLDPAKIREQLPAFIRAQMEEPEASHGYNWAQHARSGIDRDDGDVAVLRYEDLLSDPGTSLETALTRIFGAAPDREWIDAVVAHTSFERQAKRSAGTEDASSFLRKGVAGDWRNHFGAEAAEVFESFAGDELRHLGYEDDVCWVSDAGMD